MTDFIEELNKKSVDTTSSIETRKCDVVTISC